MRSRSTGTPAALRPICREDSVSRAGFTLIEALVALALLLAFVSVIGPHLFHARRIADQVDGRIAAQVLLRAILDAPFDRFALANGPREGQTGGIRWSLSAEPMFIDAVLPREREAAQAMTTSKEPAKEPADTAAAKRRQWTAFRLVAKASWAPGQMVSAESLRLGADE